MTLAVSQGDTVWISFPPQSGAEQAGRRPGLVVQADTAGHIPTVLVVPITSNQRALRFPGTLAVPPTSENGLTSPSVLLVFQTSRHRPQAHRTTCGQDRRRHAFRGA
ncbi:MAG: type II toxin-antitoxin system PemK/MazF family toxin [Planctomycetes bacterium]|nr:type II toxin-antitoxin system PemK/MazF family toxin [Planctomycetota bacterium]